MIRRRWLALLCALMVVAVLFPGKMNPAAAQATPSTTIFSQLRAALQQTHASKLTLQSTRGMPAPQMIYPAADGQPSGEADAPPAKPAVVSRIQLTPATGGPNTVVTVAGKGYAPGARLKIFVNGALASGRRLVLADAAGNFEAPITIPGSLSNGAYTVTVVEAGLAGMAAADAGRDSAPFQLTGAAAAQPKISYAAATAAWSNPPLSSGIPGGAALLAASDPQPPMACPTSAIPKARKPWTFVVYIAADSDLVNDARTTLLDIAHSGGTNANVNLVVLLDLRGEPTRYYEVIGATGNSVPELCTYAVDKTPASIGQSNLDTGNPQTFVNFLQFVGENYPATRYGVTIWSHGGGWRGIAADDTANSYWSMAGLRSALSGGLQKIGRTSYDALLFDACYMAQYEVAYEISDLAQVMVGSEEEIPSSGLRYADFLPNLRGNPSIATDAFARTVVDSFNAYYVDAGSAHYDPSATLSAFRLGSAFTTFSNRVTQFADGLTQIARTQGGTIFQEIRQRTRSYHDRDFADLGDFASWVQQSTNTNIPQSVKTSASQVVSSLAVGGALVVRETHGGDSSRSTGISAYFPTSGGKPFRGRGGILLASATIAADEAAIAAGYDRLRAVQTGWYRLIVGLRTGTFANLPTPAPVPNPPLVPPPAAAFASDITFASIVNSLQVDLYRTYSSGDEEALPLLQDGYINLYPRWSPNGQYLIYISNRGTDLSSKSGFARNLFLLNADGTPLPGESGPRQLTGGSLANTCPNGPGTGQPCTIQQSFDPAWLSDSSGILYTQRVYDLRYYPNYTVSQSIHSVAPDLSSDFEILPRPDIFGPSNGSLIVSNADLKAETVNGQPRLLYMMFRYAVPTLPGGGYNTALYPNPDFNINNIGLLDFSDKNGSGGLDPNDILGFYLNTAAGVAADNYLITDYPAWNPKTNDVAFLYNRVGNPAILQGLDPRTPPTAGSPERANPFYPAFGGWIYNTYDIGRLTVQTAPNCGGGNFCYVMRRPIWSFLNAASGVGANYRPAWNPDGSLRVVGSVSVDGGFTYDVATFKDGDTLPVILTENGQSALPSWGAVSAVKQRLEVTPRYLQPGVKSVFYLSGSGFAAGSKVQLYIGNGTTFQKLGSPVTVAADGTFGQPPNTVGFILTAAHPGPIYFYAQTVGTSTAATQTSNQDILVALRPPTVFLPVSRR